MDKQTHTTYSCLHCSMYCTRICVSLTSQNPQVQGSHEVKEFDMESFGERGKLYYESYFYIAALATFPDGGSGLAVSHTHQSPGNELVLDVPQGTAVIFQRKVRQLERRCTWRSWKCRCT